MKTVKFFLLGIWVFCTTVFLLGVLTPLDFTHPSILYATFFIAFNGVFYLSYLLTDFISLKWNRALMGLLCSIALMTAYALFPKFGSGWKTQEIVYRKVSSPGDVVVLQMEDAGILGYNKRYAKVIKVTPLFFWVTELKKVEDEEGWVRVDEYVNELGLQGHNK